MNDWDRKGVENCHAYIQGRTDRRTSGSCTNHWATQPLEVVQSDVCQLSHPSCEGLHFIVSFIDDYSKYATVYQLKRKSQVFDYFVHIFHSLEQELGQKIADLRSDNGGGYISKKMQDYCHLHGIKPTMGPPHTPELNGVSERYNRTPMDWLKPSLKISPFQQEFWSDALDYAVWTNNRSPTRTNEGHKTPYGVYKRRISSLRHAHIFGSKGSCLIPSADRKKLDNHTCDCYILGVLPNGDGVKVLDAITKRLVKSRDAFFDEHTPSLTNSPSIYHKPQISTNIHPWLYPETNHSEQDIENDITNDEVENPINQEDDTVISIHNLKST